MSSSELLAVRDKDFSAHNVEFFKEILDQEDMADVTIACDENYTVRAHKVILSAASLFFRSVIKKSQHPNPYFYLKGVSASHLNSLMSYIYSGETEVRSEDFQMFMTIASDLRISSLTSTNPINADKSTSISTKIPGPSTKIPCEKNKKVRKKFKKQFPELVDPKSEPPSDENESEDKIDWIDEAHEAVMPFDEHDFAVNEYDEKNDNGESKYSNASLDKSYPRAQFDKTISEETDKIIELLGSQGKVLFSCKICQKKNNRKTKARIHAETHLSQSRHKCPECGLESKTSSSLYVHMRRKHSAVAEGQK